MKVRYPTPHMVLRDQILSEGWLSPDTYSNSYAEIENIPAVYLFLMIEPYRMVEAMVGYVGMSRRLKSRISGHRIRPQLVRSGYIVQTWFRPVEIERLRAVEAEVIIQYDPHWNIAGRRRGVLRHG